MRKRTAFLFLSGVAIHEPACFSYKTRSCNTKVQSQISKEEREERGEMKEGRKGGRKKTRKERGRKGGRKEGNEG